MFFFSRGRGGGKPSGKDPRKHGSPSPHNRKGQKGTQWRTAKYQKLSENQRNSLDRILTALGYEIQ
jgi:hypothetical protein